MSFNKIYKQIFQQIGIQPIKELKLFNGKIAYNIAKMNLNNRQRYSGSIGNINAINDICKLLKQNGIQYKVDQFVKQSPIGITKYRNLEVDFRFNNSNKFIIIGAHHDTKYFPKFDNFQGANDGASGVGLIIGLILYIKQNNIKFPINIKFVLFDGQQCFYQYSENDGLIGSKYVANKYKVNCKAVILLDMIASKNLKIVFPINSDNKLIAILKKTLEQEQNKYFDFNGSKSIIDDTTPFEKINIPTINFIQFDYLYWHTNNDTLDKISSQSFGIIGNIILRYIKNLSYQIFQI